MSPKHPLTDIALETPSLATNLTLRDTARSNADHITGSIQVMGKVVNHKHVPVLMSADNPNGWKLEDLAVQLVAEITKKNEKIETDHRRVAQTVAKNNRCIMELLGHIQLYQSISLKALNSIGPDEGPTGKPRIGAGSEKT